MANLTQGAISRLFTSTIPQAVVRWAFLCALALGVWFGWGYKTLPGIADPFPFIYTHATTLMFWVVWFMGLVLLVPIVGRAWCSVCPLGFISDRLGRVGLNLKTPTGWNKWFWPLFVFLSGTAAALWFNAHKSPHLTAILVLAMTLFAALVSLLYRRAVFCGVFCPVGLTLGIYSRFSPVKIEPLDAGKCAGCKSNACASRKGVWKRWDMGSLVVHKKIYESGCPVALYPPKMDASECLLCMECVRKCPDRNLALFYGRRTSSAPLSPRAILLMVLLTGLISLALTRTWPALKDAVTPGAYPSKLAWTLWFGFALPFAFIMLAPIVGWLMGRGRGVESAPPEMGKAPKTLADAPSEGFWTRAGRLCAPLAGALVGGHLALALVKLNAKAAYLPYLTYDPLGSATYLAMNVAGTLESPGLVVPLTVLRYVAMLLWGLGVGFGVKDALTFWKNERAGQKLMLWVGFLAISALYGASIYHWLFQAR